MQADARSAARRPLTARLKAPKSLVRTVDAARRRATRPRWRLVQQRRGQRPVVRGADGEGVRPVGHQAPDLAEVAGGGEAPGHDHQHPPGEPLDLLEDVRLRRGSRGPRPAICAQQVHHVQPLARVHPVERLVEQQDRRVVDQRRGDLDPLPHALGVGADRPVLRGAQLHVVDGARRRRGGLLAASCPAAAHWRPRTAGRSGTGRPPRAPGRGRCADTAPGGRGSGCRPPSRCRRRAPGSPAIMCRIGRLARAVRSEQAGDAAFQPEADVVDGDHVAVPARRVGDLDCWRGLRRRLDRGRGRHAAIRAVPPQDCAGGDQREQHPLDGEPVEREAGVADRRVRRRAAEQQVAGAVDRHEWVDQLRQVAEGRPLVTASPRMALTAAVTMKTAMIAPVA